MTRKLFALARGECMEENPDSLVNQEVLTPGQLFLMFLKVGACYLHLGPYNCAWSGDTCSVVFCTVTTSSLVGLLFDYSAVRDLTKHLLVSGQKCLIFYVGCVKTAAHLGHDVDDHAWVACTHNALPLTLLTPWGPDVSTATLLWAFTDIRGALQTGVSWCPCSLPSLGGDAQPSCPSSSSEQESVECCVSHIFMLWVDDFTLKSDPKHGAELLGEVPKSTQARMCLLKKCNVRGLCSGPSYGTAG